MCIIIHYAILFTFMCEVFLNEKSRGKKTVYDLIWKDFHDILNKVR